MKRKLVLFFTLFFAVLTILSGCLNGDLDPETGAVTLSITDASLEDDSLTGVWITIIGVEFHTSEGGWQVYNLSIPDEPINLMELVSGRTVVLGAEIPLLSGRYTQVRFLLDIQETGDGVPANLGCYLTFDDDNDPSTADLAVPRTGSLRGDIIHAGRLGRSRGLDGRCIEPCGAGAGNRRDGGYAAGRHQRHPIGGNVCR